MPVLLGAAIRDSSMQITFRCIKKRGIAESVGGEGRRKGIS